MRRPSYRRRNQTHVGHWMRLGGSRTADQRFHCTVPSTQKWEHAKFHKFPSGHEVPPQGHEDIREVWASLISRDPDRLRQYLEHSAVDTNHVECTFFISDEVS